MKYFFDTEFHEYKRKPIIGKPIDTIDLISIGIVNELGREYYAVCNEFDIEAAWNSFQWEQKKLNDGIPGAYKNHWLRENVLRPIFDEFILKEKAHNYRLNQLCIAGNKIKDKFTLKTFKQLLKKYGKSKIDIAYDIKRFIYSNHGRFEVEFDNSVKDNIEFYAYYADYDWVVFCWLFGRMIDLPEGFPMYCKDLKQYLDEHFEITEEVSDYIKSCLDIKNHNITKAMLVDIFHKRIDCKKAVPQINKHNALDDAKWNLALYKFIESI